jgi:phosphoinositide-3-kinase regulatory subunit alpha/beta/delta
MLQQGISESMIKKIKEGGIDEWKPQEQTDQKLAPHNNSINWYYENCSREQAEEYLKNKRDGTFLIRKRSEKFPNQHVLSINCKDQPNHCIIYRTERGFGFAEPYNIYESLEALVSRKDQPRTT